MQSVRRSRYLLKEDTEDVKKWLRLFNHLRGENVMQALLHRWQQSHDAVDRRLSENCKFSGARPEGSTNSKLPEL